MDVTVNSNGVDIVIRMKADWHSRHKVSIVLTNESAQALLDPHPNIVWRPTITQENVKWSKARHAVYCRYKDASKNKWRFHFEAVAKGTDIEKVQLSCDRMSQLCQNFYDM